MLRREAGAGVSIGVSSLRGKRERGWICVRCTWLVPISPAFQLLSVVGRRVPWTGSGVESGIPWVPKFTYLFWDCSA